jgi:hypothetical protein
MVTHDVSVLMGKRKKVSKLDEKSRERPNAQSCGCSSAADNDSKPTCNVSVIVC